MHLDHLGSSILGSFNNASVFDLPREFAVILARTREDWRRRGGGAAMGASDDGGGGAPDLRRRKPPHDWTVFGSLLTSFYLELLGGGVYAFAVYSVHLKNEFGLAQGTIQLVGTVGNVGAWLVLPSGFFFDRYGPKPGILVGVVCVLIGYLILWGIITRRVALSVSTLCFGAFLAQHGCGWWDGTAVPLASGNFPRDRGIVVGLLKGFFGISSSVITVFYQSFFRPDIPSFILSLALVLPVGALFTLSGARMADKPKALSHEEKSRIALFGYGMLGVLVVYISCSSLYQRRASNQGLGCALVLILGSFASLVFPLDAKWMEKALNLSMDSGDRAGERRGIESGGEDEERVDLLRDNGGGDTAASDRREERASASRSNYAAALHRKEFWLMFFVCFVVMGSGITLINNIGDVVVSLDGPKGSADIYVVLISVGSCLGRSSAGLLSDHFARKWPRAKFVLANTVVMVVAQLTLCAADLNFLYFSCVLCGVGFGAAYTLLPCLLADLFGREDFGKILGTGMFAPSCGSLFFSTFVASSIYNYNIAEGSGNTCKGRRCFSATFFILACACACGSVAAYSLLRRMENQATRGH